MSHKPVLLKESIESLKIKKHGIYIDGTFGEGGHTKEILKNLNSKGKLYCIDQDPEAIKKGKNLKDPRIHLFLEKFSNIKKCLQINKENNLIDGILLDLGMSSLQLDNPKRGFSFNKDGPLDMRMNQNQGISVKRWIQKTNQKNIENVIKKFGEEKYSRRIAKAIYIQNKKKEIKTTLELSKIIKNNIPKKNFFKNPATRTFQALRIYINQELLELKKILNISLDILKTGGRLVVISFHSLEDRIIKNFIKKNSQITNLPKGLPITEEKIKKIIPKKLKIIYRIKPTSKEIINNPRSRSAILRVSEKK